MSTVSQEKPEPGSTLPDHRSGANRTEGGRNPDILISDAGNDLLVGKEGVDTYVINGTNLERVVTIKDQGINRLMIEGGEKILQLDIRKDAVLLDGNPLEKADKSLGGENAFILKIEELTLLIKPDSNISRSTQTSEAAATTNPLLQHMSHLPEESKLALLNTMHKQLIEQQNLSQQTNPNQEADRQLV